jgi:hypothetical protein
VTRLAAALVVAAGCRCGQRAAEPPLGVAPASPPTAGSAVAPSTRLAVLMVGGATVCDLVPLAEVASASGLPLDQAFPHNDPGGASCVYQDGSHSATAVTIAMVPATELTGVQRSHPSGAPLRGLARDNWYADEADDDASVLYVQDGSEQLTVAVDNGLPPNRRPVVAQKLAQLALTRR